MKVCIVQPPYSLHYADADGIFRWEMETFDKMDESMDMIVFPEYSTVPALPGNKVNMEASYHKYNEPLMAKAAETAKRCNAVVFINGPYMTEKGLRNTTVVYGRDGKEAGVYFKQHLVASEMYGYELDYGYTFEHSEPTIVEVDGVRYGFMVCYDAYFYEAFPNLARQNPDVIVACSHQRSDTHEALQFMHQFLAYNTNAYVVRSSVSMGPDSPLGGTSMIITPQGQVLANMMSDTGFVTAEIDPHKRYLKPAGFGNPPATHHSYIDIGRRPWKYRPAGSAICLPEHWMPYPRICAHRGFNTIAPENSMPAFGAAVAMGAEEIEFDLWASKDGEIISVHDAKLDRVSNGTGYIWEHTYEELKALDFGYKFSEQYTGLPVVTFEDILKKFACHAIMNIHIKSRNNTDSLEEDTLKKIIALVRKYDCEKHCYFMSGNPAILGQLRELAPDIARCAGAGDYTYDLVQKALDYGCTKIQLFKPHFQHFAENYLEDIIARAHANNLKVNYFWSDNPEETKKCLAMGIDTVLSNDYHRNAIVAK